MSKRFIGKTALSVPFQVAVLGAAAIGVPTAVNMTFNHDLDTIPAVKNTVTENYRAQLAALKSMTAEDDAGRTAFYEAEAALGQDLLLDTRVNEMAYMQFARAWPHVYPTAFTPTTGREDSLTECRIKYSGDVAASREQVAENINSCMYNNNANSVLFTVISLIAGVAGGFFMAMGLDESKTMKKWAALSPKPKNPKN